MLYRAFELKDAITKFQKSQQEVRDRNSGYSAKEDKITDDNWDEVLQFLRLLLDFVDATKHLEVNGDKDYLGTQCSLWEVFLWINVCPQRWRRH